MNFNELYKKIADLDKPAVTESEVQECGNMTEMPNMAGSAPTTPPSMSVNLNAQGLDSIADILKLIAKVNPDAAKPEMPELTIAPGISSIGSSADMDDMPEKNPPALLPDLSDEEDEMGSDDKMPEKEGFQDATTEPDPSYQDTDFMVNKLSGGLGKQQTMRKHGYKHGDNPLSMESVEDIKESLAALYQQYKAQ
jgi:hypothetical protein